MIYAAFIMWFFLLIFIGIGVYHIAARLIGGRAVSWILLPGTLISEMAWILGALVTGGEVRKARLIQADGGSAEGTESQGGLKIGPLVSALLAIVACATAVVLLDRWLGQSVLWAFSVDLAILPREVLPQALPGSWDAFWQIVSDQPILMKRICETFGELTWSEWQTPVFIYLSVCLAVRLAPARRNLRATLGAVVVLSILIGLTGLVWKDFADSIQNLWRLLTYLYALVLTLLGAMLLAWAAVSLVRVFTGKSGRRRRHRASHPEPAE